MAGHEILGRLREQASKLIGDNVLTMAAHGIAPGPASDPEKQWWNLPAKYKAAERIKGEMLRDYPGRNDAGDAARHAELSRRMASEIDPVTSYLAGIAHEVENTIPPSWVQYAPSALQDHAKDNWHGQGIPEGFMDARNNAEGLRAAHEHRGVDPTRLQTSSEGAVPPGAPYQPWGKPPGRRNPT